MAHALHRALCVASISRATSAKCRALSTSMDALASAARQSMLTSKLAWATEVQSSLTWLLTQIPDSRPSANSSPQQIADSLQPPSTGSHQEARGCVAAVKVRRQGQGGDADQDRQERTLFWRPHLRRPRPAALQTCARIYLTAARLCADLSRCRVIEDTATGVRAGLNAGATVWGYCPAGHGRVFDGLPVARVFHHMDELVAALVG
jgi:hypothetical protein